MAPGRSDHFIDCPIYPPAEARSIEIGRRTLVIQLSYLDYSAVEGKSFLHRFSPKTKLGGIGLVLLGIVTLRSLPALFSLYVIFLILFFVLRVPIKIFPLTLYPLIFAILFIFISRFQIHFVLFIFL